MCEGWKLCGDVMDVERADGVVGNRPLAGLGQFLKILFWEYYEIRVGFFICHEASVAATDDLPFCFVPTTVLSFPQGHIRPILSFRGSLFNFCTSSFLLLNIARG